MCRNRTPARSSIIWKSTWACSSSIAPSGRLWSRPKVSDSTKAAASLYNDTTIWSAKFARCTKRPPARLTVASIYSVGLAHMSRYLREFLAAHPKADVRLEYVHPHRVYEAVDQGQADLGLVSYPEESASLAALPWRTEPMVLVCHPQHPFTRRRSVSLDVLRGESFVAFQAGLKIREEIDRVLALHRVPAAMSLWNSTTSKRSSGRSKSAPASACCPSRRSRARSRSGTLVQIPIEGQPLVRPLGIIHRRDRKLSETARQFIQLLQSEAARRSDERRRATPNPTDDESRSRERTKIAG